MAELKIEVDAAEVGFDPDRLARIDRHFARYVDDGRLPGWLLVVSRAGQVAHLVDLRPARPRGRACRSSSTRSSASTR